MKPSGPLVAVDLGLQRTGLARSDPGQTVALGLPTFEVRHGRSLKEYLRQLHLETPLGGIVFGLPRHMDGRLGTLAGRVRRLADWAHREFGVPVAFWDERLTTVAAVEMLQEAPRRVRREKGARDRLAAQILLREFLDASCPFPLQDSAPPQGPERPPADPARVVDPPLDPEGGPH